MKKRAAELFAGVGGFRVGLESLKSGWNFVYANQWEPGRKNQYAFNCYSKHYGPSKELSNEDINKVNKNNIPDMELLTGGFPCQDYSVAHSGAKGIQGKKGVLWWAIQDTIKAKTPSFILLENVDRLLSSPGTKQKGRDFGMILYTLSNLGYGVQWRTINAAEYGFPQKRKRVFIFAYRNNTNYYKRISKQNNLNDSLVKHSVYAKALPIKNTLSDIKEGSISGFKDMVDFSDNFSFNFKNTGILHDKVIYTGKYTPNYHGQTTTLNDIMLYSVNDKTLFLDNTDKIKKFKYLKGHKRIERTSKNGHKYMYSEGKMSFPDDINKPGRTMLTSEHSINRSTHVVLDKKTGKYRLLDPIECERLQTFPDNWTDDIPKVSRYFVMGNALVCGLVKEIGKGIDEIISNEK